jgi:hypothetical protein
MKIIDLLLK